MVELTTLMIDGMMDVRGGGGLLAVVVGVGLVPGRSGLPCLAP